jgi:hypothetical protein
VQRYILNLGRIGGNMCLIKLRLLWTRQIQCVWLQVLNEIFNSLHRAEFGTLHEGALDPQLPQTVRVPVSAASGHEPPAVMELKPMSMVQRLFGLEVQVLHLFFGTVTSMLIIKF